MKKFKLLTDKRQSLFIAKVLEIIDNDSELSEWSKMPSSGKTTACKILNDVFDARFENRGKLKPMEFLTEDMITQINQFYEC